MHFFKVISFLPYPIRRLVLTIVRFFGFGCVWNLGTSCSGKVEELPFFSGQIHVPVCKRHLNSHKKIMALHLHNFDVETTLNQTEEDWNRTLKENNIDWTAAEM